MLTKYEEEEKKEENIVKTPYIINPDLVSWIYNEPISLSTPTEFRF